MILHSRVRLFLAFLPALLLSLGAGAATAQPDYKPAKAGEDSTKPDVTPILQGVQKDLDAAIAAVTRQDNKEARNLLKRAREQSERALRSNPASRRAATAIGMVFFWEGVAGDKNGYEHASDWLEKVVKADPDAGNAWRFLAYAYGRQNGKAREGVVAADLALGILTDTLSIRETTELKRTLQDWFLANWYEYGKYYESPGARLTRINPQNNYQLELVAQITPQFEQDLAARGLQALTPTMQLGQDAGTKAYLQKLVDKLLGKTPGGPPFTYTVDVVESPAVNAMAFPGRIFVNTGLLKFCDSEAELVAVLSHEIAHIYAHHSARALVASYQKQQAVAALLQAVQIDQTRLRDQLVVLGANLGLELLARGYSRGEEKEADKYGTHIAFNAGYNPTFMTKFFLRLFQANPKSPFKLLATHPPTTERIEYTSAYLEAFPLGTEMQIDSQEFKDMKARIK